VGPLKITKIEAVRFRRELRIQGISPGWTWVRLHTDQGIVGIGESYSGAGHESHVAVLKRYARLILGKDGKKRRRKSVAGGSWRMCGEPAVVHRVSPKLGMGEHRGGNESREG